MNIIPKQSKQTRQTNNYQTFKEYNLRNMVDMSFYVCRRIKLLSFLQDNGFKYIREQKDKDNPRYSVWVFIDSPELRSTIESYYNSKWYIKDSNLQGTYESYYILIHSPSARALDTTWFSPYIYYIGIFSSGIQETWKIRDIWKI